MLPFNYHHLYYFYVTARSGSVSRAAEELRLAQSTVSEQLRQFEQHLGQNLFTRSRRRLALTEAGRRVLDYAESIFELGREMQDMLRDRKASGRLAAQIGVLHGTARAVTHAMLRMVLDAFPGSHIVTQEGELESLLEGLRMQRLDGVLSDLSATGESAGEFTNHVIGHVPVLFAAAPKIARRYKSFPRDFHQAPLIVPTAPSQIYQAVHDFFAEHGISPRIVAEVQDVEVARRLAISGYGIVPLNASTMAASLPKGALRAIDMPGPRIEETLFLISRPRKWVNPIMQHLVANFRIGRAGET